MYTNLDCF